MLSATCLVMTTARAFFFSLFFKEYEKLISFGFYFNINRSRTSLVRKHFLGAKGEKKNDKALDFCRFVCGSVFATYEGQR